MENKRIKKFQRLAKMFQTFGTGNRNLIYFKIATLVLATGFSVLTGALALEIPMIIGYFIGLFACIDTIGECLFRHGSKFCDFAEKECIMKLDKELEIEKDFAHSKQMILKQEEIVRESTKQYCENRIDFQNGECSVDKLSESSSKDMEERLLLKRMKKTYKNQTKKARKIQKEEENELVPPSINIDEYIQD